MPPARDQDQPSTAQRGTPTPIHQWIEAKGASTVRVLTDSVLSVEEVHDTLVRAGGDFAVAAG
ncbi:hypothetical protein [Mycobacteroides abscessus]|uniref:hypothetical protein n=1 Tax=Mycobacteroides abscessus TaxID=36809 RepID=UPI001F18F618|nr:hypothetical protein [Mycobacteroides abscessus]